MEAMQKTEIIRLEQITKRYGGTVALDKVDFELFEREVLGLVGDNGAGKSTLVKVISGAVMPDSGRVYIEGSPVEIRSPADAIGLGVETIYQDLAFFGSLDLTTNIFAGREYLKKGALARLLKVVDKRKMEQTARGALSRISFNMPDIHEKVERFSGGQKQAIAITRASLWGKKIIIMDEPTAALGVQESKKVLEMIKGFAQAEHVKGIVIISHNMQHIIEVASRVIVLRQGRRAGTINLSEYQDRKDALHANIVAMITGLEFHG
jgi:fructose transport system ATP-binding protein